MSLKTSRHVKSKLRIAGYALAAMVQVSGCTDDNLQFASIAVSDDKLSYTSNYYTKDYCGITIAGKLVCYDEDTRSLHDVAVPADFKPARFISKPGGTNIYNSHSPTRILDTDGVLWTINERQPFSIRRVFSDNETRVRDYAAVEWEVVENSECGGGACYVTTGGQLTCDLGGSIWNEGARKMVCEKAKTAPWSGTETEFVTVDVASTTDFHRVCAVDIQSRLSCWDYLFDQHKKRYVWLTRSLTQESVREARSAIIGFRHISTCALRLDDRIECWNENMQTGKQSTGTTDALYEKYPGYWFALRKDGRAAVVAAGAEHLIGHTAFSTIASGRGLSRFCGIVQGTGMPTCYRLSVAGIERE